VILIFLSPSLVKVETKSVSFILGISEEKNQMGLAYQRLSDLPRVVAISRGGFQTHAEGNFVYLPGRLVTLEKI